MTLSLIEAQQAGLLSVGDRTIIDQSVRFALEDRTGNVSSVKIGRNVSIGVYTVLHGGTEIGDDVTIEEHCVVGKPEFGYAGIRGEVFDGRGSATLIDKGCILRSGSVIYADVSLGADVMIGHHSTIRTGVTIGQNSQLAAYSHVERRSSIGHDVRLSPHCHITSECIIEDEVFLGAGVLTVNDRTMIWARTPEGKASLKLKAPYFARGCKVGSGAIIGMGVMIGAKAVVGSGAVVLRDVAANTVVIGLPARLVRES